MSSFGGSSRLTHQRNKNNEGLYTQGKHKNTVLFESGMSRLSKSRQLTQNSKNQVSNSNMGNMDEKQQSFVNLEIDKEKNQMKINREHVQNLIS